MPEMAIACAFGKKRSKKLCEALEVEWLDTAGMAARATYEWESIYAACFNLPKNTSYEQAMAIIAHESCHLADRYFAKLGETEVGEETYAYTVQFISLHIMGKYRKWVLKQAKR